MAEVMIWDLWTIFFGSIAFCIFSIGGFLYLKRGKQKENFNEKIVMFGFAGTLFCFAIFMIFYFIFYLNIQGTYRDNGLYIDFSNMNIIADLYLRAAWSFYYFGLLFFIIIFEINYKRTKYILTLIGCLFILFFIIIPFKDIELAILTYFYFNIMSLFILITYARWAQIEYKIIASFLLMGNLLIGWGAGFTALLIIYNLSIIPIWIANLLFCLGGAFMMAPLFITVKNFSRTPIYIMIFSTFILGIQIILTVAIIYSGIPIVAIVTTSIFLLCYIYAQFTIVKSIKSSLSKDEQSKLEDSKLNILGVFAKPKRITEEEVSVSKEKKICLICKGKVLRNNIYLCPDCSTFYCSKCSEALVNLENACWVCDTPFDESKPVKPFEKEEEVEVEISEKPQKKP
jgi:hypothetical protein